MKVDVRVGEVVRAEPFPEARKPAYKLTIDFGPDVGVTRSSAQITRHYTTDQLTGRTVAAGVNRADLLQRQGFYPPPPGASTILGLECSGVIAQVGAGVRGWQPGDRVCALLSGGGYAEQVA